MKLQSKRARSEDLKIYWVTKRSEHQGLKMWEILGREGGREAERFDGITPQARRSIASGSLEISPGRAGRLRQALPLWRLCGARAPAPADAKVFVKVALITSEVCQRCAEGLCWWETHTRTRSERGNRDYLLTWELVVHLRMDHLKSVTFWPWVGKLMSERRVLKRWA